MSISRDFGVQTTAHAGAVSVTRRRRWRRHVAPWLFILPAVLIHVLVIGVPTIFTFVLSLTSWNGFNFGKFIGLDNYRQVFSDPTVALAIGNNIRWTVIFLTIPIALALGVALLVRSVKGSGLQMVYRTVFYLPATVSSVVVGRLWQWIYDPFYGVNTLFTSWGVTSLAQSWLSDPNLALYSVANADNWRWWGYLMIIFLAAMGAIDTTLYEAAQMDGASRPRQFWHVTLPSLRPTLVFVGLLTIIWSFQVIDLIFIMTQGGPANSTMTLSMWIYQNAVYNYAPGYASAIAVLMTLASSAFIAGFVYLRYKGWDI